MKNQKDITRKFTINRLSNNGYEITMPLITKNLGAFKEFTFERVANGIALHYKSDAIQRVLELEGIPHKLLARLYRAKMLRVTEIPPVDIASDVTMIFVNRAYLESVLNPKSNKVVRKRLK